MLSVFNTDYLNVASADRLKEVDCLEVAFSKGGRTVFCLTNNLIIDEDETINSSIFYT